jgi:hypothetical protein
LEEEDAHVPDALDAEAEAQDVNIPDVEEADAEEAIQDADVDVLVESAKNALNALNALNVEADADVEAEVDVDHLDLVHLEVDHPIVL